MTYRYDHGHGRLVMCGTLECVSRTVSASRFKAQCLSLLDEVAESGEEVIVTKRGKPVARLVPLSPPESSRAA